MKRPAKEGLYGASKRSEIFLLNTTTLRQTEEANRNNTMPYISFVDVNKETFGDDFYPPDLISSKSCCKESCH